jgi:hypothetical protein
VGLDSAERTGQDGDVTRKTCFVSSMLLKLMNIRLTVQQHELIEEIFLGISLRGFV